MLTTKRFIAILLCALLSAPATLAQNPQRNDQTNNSVSQDVLIIIGQQQVRFTAQKAVQEMQLQIFNQAGEMVHDSGAIQGPEINWPFQNANGESLKSGLYAYTLSIKEQGAETARVRRGHFIVDRAAEQDGRTDRLWVTSQNDNGVGTELTVARNDDATIAGIGIAGSPRNKLERDANGRTVKDQPEAKDGQQEKAQAANIAGTPGQLAKFTGPEDLGDSSITDNGNVGIGTVAPRGKLEVSTRNDANPTSIPSWDDRHFVVGAPSNAGGIGMSYDGLSFNGYIESLIPNVTWGNLVLQSGGGKVGIGTTTRPFGKLQVVTSNDTNPEFITAWDGRHTVFGGPDSSGGIGISYNQTNGIGYIQALSPMVAWRNLVLQSGGGNVGIGTTTTPLGKLQVVTANDTNPGSITAWDSRHHVIGGPGSSGGIGMSYDQTKGVGYIQALSPMVAWRNLALQVGGGNVGIGTNTPQEKLHVVGGFLRVDGKGNEQAYLGGDGIGGDIQLGSLNPNVSKVAIYNRTTGKYMNLATATLTITGGSDLAEPFDVGAATTITSDDAPQVKPGMVVSINPRNPGKLILSTQAYDRRVAGIISGAGGVKPGMIMSQEGTLADGKHPVALSGRVYCWVDAAAGAIEPGDLLTTSSTPGHAMKANNPAKAQGAIIGKAMTSLKEGKGLVLVLVTLQ